MDARSTVVTSLPPGHGARRTLQVLLTIVGWLVYLLLWSPGIATGLEAIGVNSPIVERLTSDQVNDLALLLRAAGLAVAFSLALVLWASNERRRFVGLERRKRRADVEVTMVAEALGADASVVEQAQSASVMRVHCRPDGSVSLIERLDAAAGSQPVIPRQRTSGSHPEPVALSA